MNTTLKGDLFEQRAYEIILKAINEGQLASLPANCRVFQKKAYYSKDRESNIIFDLSIEVWLEGAEQYQLLYLIECKDYSSPVPVNDVEEFVTHIRQVTGVNAKGIFITTRSLQQGALNYARSQGVMLIEVDQENNSKIVLHNKNRKDSQLTDSPVAPWSAQANKLAEISETLNANSIGADWDEIIKDFLTLQLNTGCYWEQPDKGVMGLEYLSHQLIEEITVSILEDFDASILYKWKSLEMERFIPYFEEKFGVQVVIDQTIPIYKGKKLNGYCDFENKKVYIDESLVDTGQFAFVCAHEMAHFFLHSNLKIAQQVYDSQSDSKYDPAIRRYALLTEKHWIEWQANQFAASLIMPRKSVLGKLIQWQVKEGIRNRGKVYLDHQPINIRDFKVMITLLAFEFKASRTILEYRMNDLGIIKYANPKKFRSTSLFGHIRQAQSISTIIDKLSHNWED